MTTTLDRKDVLKYISTCSDEHDLDLISIFLNKKLKLLTDQKQFNDDIFGFLNTESDLFENFLKQKIEVTLDDSIKLKLDDIYSEWNSWYTNVRPSCKVPGKKQLKSNLQTYFKGYQLPENKNCWKRLKIISSSNTLHQSEDS